jgi:hypothetical protein
MFCCPQSQIGWSKESWIWTFYQFCDMLTFSGRVVCGAEVTVESQLGIEDSQEERMTVKNDGE